MALVIPNVGESNLLERMLNNTSGTNDFFLRLYTNTPTLGDTTVIGDFTQPIGGWYSQKTLTTGSWSISIVSNEAAAEYAEQSFTLTGSSETIVGYYIVFDDGVSLLWAEEFASARTLNNGDILKLTPKFTFTSAN